MAGRRECGARLKSIDRNIGRAIALELAPAGAAAVVNARANQLEAEAVVRAVEPAGGRTCPRQQAAVRRRVNRVNTSIE